MYLTDDYDIGAKLWFDLILYGISTQFEVKVKGTVKRKDKTQHYNIYGIAFNDVPPDIKIRIDETIHRMRPREFLS
jgi:hypothetical protein